MILRSRKNWNGKQFLEIPYRIAFKMQDWTRLHLKAVFKISKCKILRLHYKYWIIIFHTLIIRFLDSIWINEPIMKDMEYIELFFGESEQTANGIELSKIAHQTLK